MFRSRFFVAMLCAVLVLGALPAHPTLAQPDGERADRDQGEGVADMSTLDMEQLRGLMQRFIATYYLSGEDMTPEEIAAIYAQHVDYFGDRRKPLSSIIDDKQAYYRRWPQRDYVLVPDTFQVQRSGINDSRVEVKFQYDFDVRSPRRTSAGRGLTRLTFDVATPGGKLIRETGSVLRRYRE